MSSELSILVGVLSFLVFLALEGLVLAGAARLALRILKLEGPTYRKLIVSGLAQVGAGGFFIVVAAQAMQLSPAAGIALMLVIILLVGLAEMRRALTGPWKQILAPWGLTSLLQLLFGLPAAFVFMWLVLGVLNWLFPPVF